jgi:predicted DNA-binding transcriptional regulator AlpA
MNSNTENHLLSTREAAKLLGMKPATLDAWRCRNKGPDWVVVGSRAIRYRLSVLTDFIHSGEVEISSKMFF